MNVLLTFSLMERRNYQIYLYKLWDWKVLISLNQKVSFRFINWIKLQLMKAPLSLYYKKYKSDNYIKINFTIVSFH